MEARPTDDGTGRLRIVGNLGDLAAAALADAALAFHNNHQALAAKYQLGSCDICYYWWSIFSGLTRRYNQAERWAEANFTKFMTAKVLEPAYNFRGIEPSRVGDHVLPVAVLLAFYVVYTLWYGLSILWVFEGLGVTTRRGGQKKEA